MDEIGRGTSTYDGLALAWAIARHLVEKSRCYSLFATHYFELTELAMRFKEVANVHFDAVEHKDHIVFLHSVEEGPANQSYGLQVAQLAGVPSSVIRAARRNLADLEEKSIAATPQRDLFANPNAKTEPEPEMPAEHPLLGALRAIDPDALTPRDALELIYRMRKALDT
jgi:DNA mismatch repair protein MutS